MDGIFTIIAGSEVCNARCPFCISKMTQPLGVPLGKPPEVNWRNFHKACHLAQVNGISTVLITGKGEPTLFPSQISDFLVAMNRYDFPLIELQTNGIMMAKKPKEYSQYLKDWYGCGGMTTIAVSIVHYEPEKNRQIYLPYQKDYIDLKALIEFLHGHGLSVRLTCTMLKGFIDSGEEVANLVSFARENKAEQLTIRPVNAPKEEASRNEEVGVLVRRDMILAEDQIVDIKSMIAGRATLIRTLSYGAQIYDFGGQNLCLSNCLTVEGSSNYVRNFIFFQDGHIRTSWDLPGSIVL